MTGLLTAGGVAVYSGSNWCKLPVSSKHCKRSSPSYASQASTSVRHLLLPCHWSQRNTIVPDLIKCYGAQLGSRGGVRRLQMLVFCIQAAIA